MARATACGRPGHSGCLAMIDMLPAACRIPGSASLRDNSQGTLQYCRVCKALQAGRCIRSRPERIRNMLGLDAGRRRKRRGRSQVASRERLCNRCQTNPPLPGYKNCAECLERGRKNADRYRKKRLHCCATPGCTKMVEGTHCRRHAATATRKHTRRSKS